MTNTQRLVVTSIAVAIVAFLIGFGWQYFRASAIDRDLMATQDTLVFERLETTIAAATIEADRTNYTVARQFTSDFFTGLQNELRRVPEEKRAEIQSILSLRDNVITAASRNDPMTSSLLSQIYSAYRTALGKAPLTAIPPQ